MKRTTEGDSCRSRTGGKLQLTLEVSAELHYSSEDQLIKMLAFSTHLYDVLGQHGYFCRDLDFTLEPPGRNHAVYRGRWQIGPASAGSPGGDIGIAELERCLRGYWERLIVPPEADPAGEAEFFRALGVEAPEADHGSRIPSGDISLLTIE